MHTAKRPAKVFLYQNIGFLVIIAVCFLDELTGLSSLILGNQPYIIEFRGSILKMLLILCVWLLVNNSTRRLLAETRYLSEFMRVCAWCRRIEHKGRWMPLEQFFKLGFDTPTSHGICEECLRKTKAGIAEVKQSKAVPLAPNTIEPAQSSGSA